MHGRLKVKTTEEQQEAKRKEQEKKLKIYKGTLNKIFAKREENCHDEEGLVLTEKILEKNPEFSTLWNFRREILLTLKPTKTDEELQKIGLHELRLTEVSLQQNAKSYGAWHHRFWSMELLPNPDWKNELKLCNMFLGMDERNFHCWDYRRSIVKKCSTDPKDELAFTIDLIKKNFSNYSSWHYRSKLLPIVHPGTGYSTVDENTLLDEYELVQNAAFTDPNDQSVWFYHRWLLGRGTKDLEIKSVTLLSKLQVVIVFLSCPVSSECLKLFVDGLEADVVWKAAGNEKNGSQLWFCKIPPDMSGVREAMEFSVCVEKDLVKNTIRCVVNGTESTVSQATKNAFSSDITAATKDVLERELESCEQLYELEPENKWTLFTSVLLMRAIDGKKYDATVSKYLEMLTTIDAMRASYYRDLRSKFLIENYIENMNQETRSLSLANRGLTSLRHFEHFYLMRVVDLSSNQLGSVYPLCYLLCVEELILDDNQISECTDMSNLFRLKKLSVKNNHIKTVQSISALCTCTELKELYLLGNPLAEIPDLNKQVKHLLGAVTLDDEQL